MQSSLAHSSTQYDGSRKIPVSTTMTVSMNSPNSSVRVRGGRTRHKTTSPKRSVSGDDKKYIEHLEGELSAAQSEIPSVAQELNLKMNRMSAENRQLQAQIQEWETRYAEEVRDFVQQHTVVERQLRNRNTNLEDYASRAKDRVAELESQVQHMQQALEGAEAANRQLEKRIEIMSELLTCSSTRVESSTDAPARRPRLQTRPLSMLPRLPNHRGSWIGSPERTPDFGALTSPTMSYTHPHDTTPDKFEPLERIVSREVWSSSSPMQPSERGDERPLSIGSTAALSDHYAIENRRPARRMRRFHGGSNGPKPLILPYASQVDTNTMTAPPLDRHETISSLPFRRSVQLDSIGSPRPRAVTSASDNALQLIDTSESSRDDTGFSRVLNLAQQSSDSPYSFASAGSEHTGAASRNLFDELHAVRLDDDTQATLGSLDEEFEPLSRINTTDSEDQLFMIPAPHLPPSLSRHIHTSVQWDTGSVELSPLQTRRDPFNPALETIMGPFHNTGADPDVTPKALAKGGQHENTASDDTADLSALDRMMHIFGDLHRSPADLARMVVHVTQQRMHIPAPLLSVQWWVVGLLWGPMIRRRMIQHPSSESRFPFEDVGSRSPSLALDESLAYGTVYTSPTSGLRRRAGMAGPGKKRSVNSHPCTKDQNSLLSRHHPLMWLKFSFTLTYAIGVAFTSGPGTLLQGKSCTCPECKANGTMNYEYDCYSF